MLSVVLAYVIKPWILPGYAYEFKVVYLQREISQYLLSYNNMKYTCKNENERKSVRDICVYYFTFVFKHLSWLKVKICVCVCTQFTLKEYWVGLSVEIMLRPAKWGTNTFATVKAFPSCQNRYHNFIFLESKFIIVFWDVVAGSKFAEICSVKFTLVSFTFMADVWSVEFDG